MGPLGREPPRGTVGGYRALVKVMNPLDELWEGIEAFDEEAADRALVGLLWDVPLARGR